MVATGLYALARRKTYTFKEHRAYYKKANMKQHTVIFLALVAMAVGAQANGASRGRQHEASCTIALITMICRSMSGVSRVQWRLDMQLRACHRMAAPWRIALENAMRPRSCN